MNRNFALGRKLILCAALVSIAFVSVSRTSAQDRGQARSMVISRNGIVAAESPLAAQAGVEILEHGGNAVDAAIAGNATMGVVAPMMNGIGGDLFVIVYDAKANKLYGLNASGWAPKGLTPEYLHKQGLRDMPQAGVNSITVPGVVDGWQKLVERFGRRKLADDLAPAIRIAQDGFPVPEMTSAVWGTLVDLLRTDDAATKLYLPQDHAPRTGEIFKNPELAESLREIAAGGRDAYYKGAIAAKILDTIKRHGGVMTAQDLAEYSSEWVEPISTTYRDWTVYEMPPNSQGLAALEMLNILETFPLGQKDTGFGSTKTLQDMIEAKKLAYADLAKYIGDPRKQQLPTAILLSKDWAADRAKLIDPDHANCDVSGGVIGGGTDTTYLSVVDRDGNMVSLIQSNYQAFRVRDRCRRNGICAARSRRTVQPRSGVAESAGWPQASAAYDHSGVRAEGRHAHGLRDHGRVESGAGPRTIYFRYRRFQNEHSRRDGSAAVYQENFSRLRCGNGKSLLAKSTRRTGC